MVAIKHLAASAVAGAAGAVLRYTVSNAVYRLFGQDFPYGTLAVNVLGSLLIGYGFVVLIERSLLGDTWRLAILVGLLGSFTTFSTFSLETLSLFTQGAALRASVNVVASVVLCLAACWAGIVLGRQ